MELLEKGSTWFPVKEPVFRVMAWFCLQNKLYGANYSQHKWLKYSYTKAILGTCSKGAKNNSKVFKIIFIWEGVHSDVVLLDQIFHDIII